MLEITIASCSDRGRRSANEDALRVGPAADTRWRDWTASLPDTLTAPLPQGPQITLMHGLQDDSAQAMADGRMQPDGTFHASSIAAKCPSKYESASATAA